MRILIPASVLFLAACGATQFNTHDPYADAGAGGGDDAGSTGGGAAGGGGGATGGGGGGTTGGGGGGATGGGSGGGATGGGGGASGGGGGSATGGGGGATGGGGGSTGGGGGASCTAANCAQGCCQNGTCQTGTTAAQCGKLGVACAVCPAATDICKADQACGLDPAATWEILATGAVVAATNGGSNWDLSSGPDTELGLWCPSSEMNISSVPPIVYDDFTPNWTTGECTATAAQLLADGVGFDALEIDDLSSPEEIAPFTVMAITEADLRAGTKTVGPSGDLTSITFRFTKQ